MDYTAQGLTVGLAQRMEQLAAADSTYLTQHTASLVEGFFALRDLGEFTIKANNNAKEFFVDPTPTATQCTFECVDGVQVKIGLVYEYLSSQWAQAVNGVPKADFTVDTDTFMLSDRLLKLSIKYRWLSNLSQTYLEEKLEFERALGVAKAQDGGSPKIRMDHGDEFIYPNIPESGIGL